ncbi:HSP20-like chaperone [Massarina eburnea CBS 473.64]|uniref:HSP20-like chaperone n=1 Tax=Massarina eburnea CBS 473.64 TaxID=1395130 RepID=A0A6A6RMV2_9PLEO|nr:HSP20-like chaperone [Massarina eburnea CBS 473.64]
MAFFLTPRFAPTYQQQCSPWSCAPVRPQYSYRRLSRPSFSNFVPFLGEVDELLSELAREERREAHRQRQQRNSILRAYFNVHENNEGYQVDGEVPGFEQDNIEIEVMDAHTLRVAGNTEKTEPQPQPKAAPEEVKAIEPETNETPQTDSMEGVTLNEPEQEAHSDTSSQKSYQATVEDDFEDLGAETSSTLSVNSSASDPKEPKGKEKAVEPVSVQPQPEAPAQQRQRPEEDEHRFHGSFERTFRFPERIDAATVKASLKNGLLSITVPKTKAPEVRRILIQ